MGRKKDPRARGEKTGRVRGGILHPFRQARQGGPQVGGGGAGSLAQVGVRGRGNVNAMEKDERLGRKRTVRDVRTHGGTIR